MTATLDRNSDYPYIRAYEKYMRSKPYFLRAQLEMARKENAPQTACFKNFTLNRWVTIDQLKPYTIEQIERIINNA